MTVPLVRAVCRSQRCRFNRAVANFKAERHRLRWTVHNSSCISSHRGQAHRCCAAPEMTFETAGIRRASPLHMTTATYSPNSTWVSNGDPMR